MRMFLAVIVGVFIVAAAPAPAPNPTGRPPTPVYHVDCSRPATAEDASVCADRQAVRLSAQANQIGLWNAVGLIVSLLVSGVALVMSAKAAFATERQATHAEDATRKSLRAYLVVEKVELVWNVTGDFAFDVWVKNSGQTPATYFELTGITVLTDMGQKLPVAHVPPDFIRWVPIGRDQTRSARLHPSNRGAVKGADVVGKPKVIALYGVLRYADIFGEVWTEEFTAFRWSATGSRQKMSFATKTGEAPDAELLEDA